MKQKVLYIITKSDVGGAQKYVADLANSLDKNQFEAKILYGGKDLKWLSNKVWPWAFFLNDWLAIFELIKILKKEQPHIIHLNSSKAGVIGSLAAFLFSTKLKFVFTAHGWVFNPTNKLSSPARWFYVLLHKFAAIFQDKIICVSEYDRQLALKYKIAPETKLITVHNGIDPNIPFLDQQTARKELIKRLAFSVQRKGENKNTLNANRYILNPDIPWVGSIGRLVKEKDYETFIRAAALIPNAHFFIIGTGPEKERLKTKSQKLKSNMHFINPTENDAKYLKAFDVFIMSSIKEGCPYILLEAMAAELLIVVTEAGGMPEMIKNNENGFVVPQKNPQALADAIQKLTTNKNIASEFGQITKKTIQEKFELKKLVAKTTATYKAIIPNS